MKYLFLVLLFFSFSFSQEYKAVFDCESNNASKKRYQIEDLQNQLEILKELYKVQIKACNIALNRYGLKKKDIIDFVDIVKNSWQEIIILQNKGYALVPFE